MGSSTRKTTLQAKITALDTAISAILRGGQSYTINSGGSTRTVTMADYNTLVKERNALQQELDTLNGEGGSHVIMLGW